VNVGATYAVCLCDMSLNVQGHLSDESQQRGDANSEFINEFAPLTFFKNNASRDVIPDVTRLSIGPALNSASDYRSKAICTASAFTPAGENGSGKSGSKISTNLDSVSCSAEDTAN